MMIHQCLLDRMKAAVVLQSLDGDDMLAIQLVQEMDAGINGLITKALSLDPADQDRAGPAVAFRADYLGAEQMPLGAQKVGQRGEGGIAADLAALAVDVE